MKVSTTKLAVAVAVAVLTTVFARAQDTADPCSVAAAPARYPAAASGIAAPLRATIAQYKADWQVLCSTHRGKTIGQLLADANSIAAKVDAAVLPPDSKEPSEPREAFVVTIGSFLPGIYGAIGEYGGVHVSLAAFARRAALGSDEDRMFFAQWTALSFDGNMPPWIEQTWDYGGCTKFGEHDWRKTIAGLEAVQSRLHEPAYKQLADGRERGLLDELRVGDAGSGNPMPICVCKLKSDVSKDLQLIRGVFSASARYKTFLAPLDALMAKIAAKQIEIKSEAEAHCSGG